MAKKKASKKKPAKPKAAKITPDKQDVTPYPTAGRKIKDFEDAIDAALGSDHTHDEPKRGPGRPKKEQPETETSPAELDQVIRNLIKMPFELWAVTNELPALALSEKEAAQLAGPVRTLLDHYLPKIPVIAYAWVSLSVSTFWIFRPRLIVIAEVKKQKSAEAEGSGHGGGQGPARRPAADIKFPTAEETKQVSV